MHGDRRGRQHRFAEFDITVTPQPTVYDFSGLLAPIDALPVVNKAKAGSSLPVKFSLGGDFGLDVLAGGSPGSQDVPCRSGATDTPRADRCRPTSPG